MRRDVFQAIADPTRRDIINLIAHKSLNLNTIAEQFDMSRPAISQHIKILSECGIIMINQQGRERYCEIQPKKLIEVVDWLEPFKKLWEGRFNQLDNLLSIIKKQKNEQ
ncbi:metalloregulator ArsR/SmtB family transcription factor [Reichenbachiella sp. MALMAid0571]|uniref:ArsR/SmtB family transcription factor n=1 Tax=Reichenbachiella sp. MALMAid0571 TaxID=3143939 RepID=UPI0032DEAD12